jgi:NADP-dependent alcohol dehydrogenase
MPILDFTFYNPTRIFFGSGAISRALKLVPSGDRVMVVYGTSSAEMYGVLQEVREALQGHEIIEFGGIEPNPEYEKLREGWKLVRERRVDFLVAIGGGSVIDATKFIAAAAVYPQDPWSIVMDGGKSIAGAIPLGAVVTLPASGSESNNRAVISRKSLNIKRAFMNDHLFPRFAALDPTKTFPLPPRYTANGVVDTFVHILEQYLTYPVEAEVQDRLAEGLLLVLLRLGPQVLKEPNSYNLRANLMWCATLGLNGLLGAGVPQDWAAHRAGYEFTVLYGLDHAQTLAILIPAMMDVRRSVKREKLLQYGERIFGIRQGSDNYRIDQAILKTKEFFEEMGVPTRIKDYGIENFDIDLILTRMEEHGLFPLGERADITREVMEEILKRCR